MQIRKKVGLIGYGVYIPKYRLKVEDLIRHNYKNNLEHLINEEINKKTKGLLLEEKAVCSPTQDAITMAIEAVTYALKRANINPKEITHIRVGSESNPYAVKPIAATVAEFIGANNANCLDVEFACTAAVNALEDCVNAVKSGGHKYSLLVATDTAQAKKNDELEYSVGDGACALIFGKTRNPIMTIRKSASRVYDTCDFWRREGEEAPTHTGRGTVPSYAKCSVEATNNLLEKTKGNIKKYNYLVFHQPNGKIFFWVKRNEKNPIQNNPFVELTEEEFKQKTNLGSVVKYIGNCFTAVVLIGLANIIENSNSVLSNKKQGFLQRLVNIIKNSNSGKKVLLVSYGSGKSSTGEDIVIGNVKEKINLAPTVNELISKKEYISIEQFIDWKYNTHLREEFNEETIEELINNECRTLHGSIDDLGIGKIISVKENNGDNLPILATINVNGIDKEINVVDGCIFKPGGNVKITIRKLKEEGKEGPIIYGLAGTII